MEKTKSKINAKKFLEDFRSGKSDEELMSLHGLDYKGLNKVLRLLVERKLLDEAELLAGHSFRSVRPKETPSLRKPSIDLRLMPDGPATISGSVGDDDTRCPQCGATVTTKILTCPECGHVLPGEDRWANVEPKQRFFDRVPPKLLGTILALPILVILLYVFKDLIIPIAEVKIEKNRDALKQDLTKSRESLQAAKELAAKRGMRGVQATIERLIAEEILQRVEPDYATVVAGPRWNEISTQEKETYLSEIRSAMRNASMDGQFDLIDPGGSLLARVKPSSISFGLPDEGPDSTWSTEDQGEQTDEGGGAGDALRRTLERRLSPDKPHGEQ